MRLHTVADYWTLRYQGLEDRERNVPHAYLDPAGIPTIGIGLNLQTHGWLVLEALGFDMQDTILSGEASATEQDYIGRVLAVINPQTPY